MISGLNILPSSDIHPNNAIIGDAYFNTDDNCMYIYDGKEWVILSPSLSFDRYLMKKRKDKINKLLNKIKNYESN